MSRKRMGAKEPFARVYASVKDHPRIDQAGHDAVGVWVRALAYCADHQTDGFVSATWLEGIGGKALKKAIDAGLIHKIDNGYVVHDYLDHNRSRAQIEEIRAKERAKKAAGKNPGQTQGVPRGNGGGNGSVVPLGNTPGIPRDSRLKAKEA